VLVLSLDGNNLKSFLNELGSGMYDVILRNIKRNSPTLGLGGMKLMRDITEYKQLASKFECSEVDTKFEILRYVMVSSCGLAWVTMMLLAQLI
jgi:hypothetical protein